MLVEGRSGYTLDLNDTDPRRLAWQLEGFLPGTDSGAKRKTAEGFAARILERRQEKGRFRSLEDISGILPGWLEQKIKSGFRRNLRRMEFRLDQEVSNRRSLRQSTSQGRSR